MEKMKKIACVTVAGTIFITGLGVTFNTILKRKSDYDGKPITSHSDEYKEQSDKSSYTINFEENETETIVDTTNKVESTTTTTTTIDNILDNEKDDKASYQKLKNELISVLQEKDITGDEKILIIATFDRIYNNYSSFEEVYKQNNALSKEDFIRKNIINNLKYNISSFKLVNLNTYDGDAFGGYYSPSNKTIEIGYYGSIIDDLGALIDESLITKAAHEICHSGQLALFKNENIDPNLLLIFTEGQSTVKQTTTNDYYSLMSGMNFSTEEDGICYSIKGISNNNREYIIYSKCYGALYSIVDHEVLETVNKTGNVNLVADYITNTYGVDGRELLNNMSKLCEEYGYGVSQDICASIENLEKNINKCFNEKLKHCDTKEELIDFMNLKRNYNMQFASVCLTNYEDEYNYEIASKSKLDPYNINDTLYYKCVEYGVLPTFSDNEKINRAVFGSIMGESSDYFSYYAVGEETSILDQKYSLSDDEKVLTIYDKDNKPIIQFDYKNNEVIREQENINHKYVTSSPKSIVQGPKHTKVL